MNIGSSSSLTSREIQVINVMATGTTSKEAADKLYLSKRTVDWHLRRAYKKMGVKKLTQAFVEARKLGVLSAN